MNSIEIYPQLLVKVDSAVEFVNDKIALLKKEAKSEDSKLIGPKLKKIGELMQSYLAEEDKFKLLYNRSNDLRVLGGIPKETDVANDSKIESILSLKSGSNEASFDSKSIISFFLNVEVVSRNLNKVDSLGQFIQFGSSAKQDCKNIQLFNTFKNLWMSVSSLETDLKKLSTTDN